MWNKKAEADKLALIKESCRNGEVRLRVQMELAIAADQRASGLAGIYVATATAIMGAVVLADRLYQNYAWLAGAGATALCLFWGSLFCIWSTRPVLFSPPGGHPKEWEPHIKSRNDISEVMWEYACCIDGEIHNNRNVMSKNSRLFKIGTYFGVLAPAVGLVSFGFLMFAKYICNLF